MVDQLSASIGIAQIVLQLGAAWYAFKIKGLMGDARFWSLVIIALLLMTLRRVTASAIEFSLMPNLTGWIAILDRLVLPFLISLFLLLGLYELNRKLGRKMGGMGG